LVTNGKFFLIFIYFFNSSFLIYQFGFKARSDNQTNNGDFRDKTITTFSISDCFMPSSYGKLEIYLNFF